MVNLIDIPNIGSILTRAFMSAAFGPAPVIPQSADAYLKAAVFPSTSDVVTDQPMELENLVKVTTSLKEKNAALV